MNLRFWTWFRSNHPTQTARPSSPEAATLFGLGPTTAGVHVNAETALRCSAWWSGIKLLSDSTALLRCGLHDKEKGGPDTTHPAARVLRSPSRVMTRFTFFQTLMNHVLSRGNGYAEILLNKGTGRVGELALMDPNFIRPEWTADGAAKIFRDTRTNDVWQSSQVIHIPGLGFDGLGGYNVVDYARQAIGLDLAAEGYGAAWFGSGGRPAVTLKHPGKLSPEAQARVEQDWVKKHGPGTHNLALLQEGLDLLTHDNDPSKAQAIETRKMQLAVVARFLRIPPHMLYDIDSGQIANLEVMSMEFLTYSLGSWLTLIEEEMECKLLTEEERDRYEIQFDESGLLPRGSLAQAQADQIDISAGVITVAEVREKRNLPLKKGTDRLRVPLNYGTLNDDGSVTNHGEGNPNGNGISNQYEEADNGTQVS